MSASMLAVTPPASAASVSTANAATTSFPIAHPVRDKWASGQDDIDDTKKQSSKLDLDDRLNNSLRENLRGVEPEDDDLDELSELDSTNNLSALNEADELNRDLPPLSQGTGFYGDIKTVPQTNSPNPPSSLTRERNRTYRDPFGNLIYRPEDNLNETQGQASTSHPGDNSYALELQPSTTSDNSSTSRNISATSNGSYAGTSYAGTNNAGASYAGDSNAAGTGNDIGASSTNLISPNHTNSRNTDAHNTIGQVNSSLEQANSTLGQPHSTLGNRSNSNRRSAANVMQPSLNQAQAALARLVTIDNPNDNGALRCAIIYFSQPEQTRNDDFDELTGASVFITKNQQRRGTVQHVAHVIAKEVQGDVYRLSKTTSYPSSHDALIYQASLELDTEEHPPIQVYPPLNLSSYDVVFIGYPIWWYDLPMPLYSFLEKYDLSGRIIIPFCTHGGSRAFKTFSIFAEYEPNAYLASNSGLVLSREDATTDSERLIHEWLKNVAPRLLLNKKVETNKVNQATAPAKDAAATPNGTATTARDA